MPSIRFLAETDFNIKSGEYYTIMMSSETGRVYIIDCPGNYSKLGNITPLVRMEEK